MKKLPNYIEHNIQYSYHRYGLSSLTKPSLYTQSAINAFLAAKADSTYVYTQSEIKTFLAAKADSTDVYTQSVINTFLATKADSPALISMRCDLLLTGQLSSCMLYMPLAFSSDCVVQQGTKLNQLTDGTTTYGTWTPVTKTLDPREGIELTSSDYVVVGYF